MKGERANERRGDKGVTQCHHSTTTRMGEHYYVYNNWGKKERGRTDKDERNDAKTIMCFS